MRPQLPPPLPITIDHPATGRGLAPLPGLPPASLPPPVPPHPQPPRAIHTLCILYCLTLIPPLPRHWRPSLPPFNPILPSYPHLYRPKVASRVAAVEAARTVVPHDAPPTPLKPPLAPRSPPSHLYCPKVASHVGAVQAVGAVVPRDAALLLQPVRAPPAAAGADAAVRRAVRHLAGFGKPEKRAGCGAGVRLEKCAGVLNVSKK